MTGPTPLLDCFKRGEVARDVRLLAAQGALAPRAHEQLAILILLCADADTEIQAAAGATLNQIPEDGLRAFLARTDAAEMREFFANRGLLPGGVPAPDSEEPLIDTNPPVLPSTAVADADRESLTQKLAGMSFTERLKAAVKGSKEMRAALIRDPNKMIASAVLSSPKLTEQEVESFVRMGSVSEDVLRVIGANRAWTKNYGVLAGLARNPKTPLAMSLNLLNRLNERDVQMISMDRNVPGALRIAARKKSVESTSKK